MPITPVGDSRGISSVIGVTLVIGMVIAASAVIVVVGATTLDNTQQSISTENALVQMEELNARLLDVAANPDEQIRMSIPSGNAELTVEDTGWINVTVENRTGFNKTTGQMTLGQITWTANDQEIAIQGGGVWRSNIGHDGAVAHKAPTIKFNFDRSNPTLSLSVFDVSNIEIQGGDVTVEGANTPTKKLQTINPIEPGSELHITLQSEFYRGWGEYFERLNGTTTYLHDENKVKVTIPAMPGPIELDNGIIAQGNLSSDGTADVDGGVVIGGHWNGGGASGVNGTMEENHSENERLKSASSIIDDAHDRLKGEDDPPDSGEVTEGPYFDDDDDLFTDNTTLNTTNGDIEIYVSDGDKVKSMDITGDGEVTIYINGTFHMDGQATWGDQNHTDSLTVYAENVDRITEFYGTLYTDGADVQGKGDRKGLFGALVSTAESVELGGNVKVTYDETLSETEILDPKIERGAPPKIKYLQIKLQEFD